MKSKMLALNSCPHGRIVGTNRNPNCSFGLNPELGASGQSQGIVLRQDGREWGQLSPSREKRCAGDSIVLWRKRGEVLHEG